MEFIKIPDLNEYLITNPVATFFVRVSGHSMIGAGIYSGDTLLVEKALTAENNDVIVACLNGEFTVKRFVKQGDKIYLYPENPAYQPIEIIENMDFDVWAIVKYSIRSMSK